MRACDSCLDSLGRSTGWMVDHWEGYRTGRVCPTCRGRAVLPSTPAEYKHWERIMRGEELTSILHPAPTPRDHHEVTP